MHIQSVAMKDCAFSPETGQFRATLVLDTEASRMSLRSATPYRAGMSREDLMIRLLNDALRQIRRMPEHRGTHRSITIAEGALTRHQPMPMVA